MDLKISLVLFAHPSKNPCFFIAALNSCIPLVALNNYFLYKEVKPQMLKVGAHEK
jgi:hypothetical protein